MAKKITVIGAGIVGIATACYLKRDGHQVTVVDMRPPGEYCSFGNAGILSPGSCVPQSMPGILAKVPGYLADPLGPLTVRWRYLPRALPWLARFIAAGRRERVERAADALRALLRQTFDAYAPLVRDAGCADLIRRTGYVVVYETGRSYRGDALAWKLRRERGIALEELDAAGIGRLVPALAKIYEKGVYLPEQGYVANPERLTKSLAAQFQKDGGTVLQREVLDIGLRDGAVHALETGGGSLPVETLVVCAGVHSGELTAKLGEPVPIEAERGYHVTFSDPALELPMPVSVADAKFFVTPMEMGLRIAGQAEFAGIYAEPDYARADVLARHLQRMLPGVRMADSTKWMGRRPAMPDSLPVISASAKHRNVYYAFGHGHVGLCGGAPTGRIIADLVSGRRPSIDVAPFRVDRF
ncbi:MAG: FAD-dependent oxidoreductase [Betaproteobacteria bacterium]|nr:FAD-dependent oxidoreductase [Betaproteobacteria bacterium]